MTQGGIDRRGHLMHALGGIGLVGDGLLDLLTDVDDSEIDKAGAAVGIEARSRLHQPDIALADEIVHLQATAFILVGDRDHKAEVGLNQLVQCTAVALLDFLRKGALLFCREQRLAAYLIEVSVQS